MPRRWLSSTFIRGRATAVALGAMACAMAGCSLITSYPRAESDSSSDSSHDRAGLDLNGPPADQPRADSRTTDRRNPQPGDTDGDGVLDADDPCPTAFNRLLFEDDFNGTTAGPWVKHGGSWQILNGEVVQSRLDDLPDRLYNSSVTATDVYVETSVTRIEGLPELGSTVPPNLVGAVVRSSLPTLPMRDHTCAVNLRGGSYPAGMLGASYDDPLSPFPTQRTESPMALTGSGPFQVRFSARGPELRCWIAGHQATAAAWSRATPASGKVGLFTQYVTARFDAIRVYAIPLVCN